MESPDPSGAVSAVIRVIRKVTRAAQFMPFIYLLFYAVYLFVSLVVPDEVLGAIDSFAYVSPAAGGGLLVASRILKLCRWHRVACLIPFSSQIENYIDSFLFTFTQQEIVAINVSLGIASVLFLIIANRHFFHDGRAEK